MKVLISCIILLMIFSSLGCASLLLEKKINQDDIKLNSIKIRGEVRPYYTITVGEKPKKNIIFYLTGTGCHDPSINASVLFDNPKLNSTIFVLPKIGVSPNQFGGHCSSKYIKHDNLKIIANDTRLFIEKKLLLFPSIDGQKVILYGESEGADIAVRLANHLKKITDIIITHRGMGLSNTDERNLSHKLRFKKNKIRNKDSVRLTKVANGASYPSEMIIFKRKVKNWREFFSIKQQPVKSLYKSKKKIFIYLGMKDLTSPMHGLTLSMKYFCARKNNNLTAVADKGAGHTMIPFPFFKTFSNLKKTIEQWIIGKGSKRLYYSRRLERLKCQ